METYHYWQDQIKSINELHGFEAFQTAFKSWPDLVMRQAFFRSALQGIVYSLVFSALILYATSRSSVLTFFSLLCIGNVLLTILAFVHLLNWRFGLSESICLIVFIGLSVDYVVHISHSYSSAIDSTRRGKVKYSISQMGPTILSGAVTSCMAGIFLV